MKILEIESCEIRQNPNHLLMGEGKDFASIVFKTDEGNSLYIDLVNRNNGNLRIDIILSPQPTGKTYTKYIEINTENGTIIKNENR